MHPYSKVQGLVTLSSKERLWALNLRLLSDSWDNVTRTRLAATEHQLEFWKDEVIVTMWHVEEPM